jgi:hypothetical protein
MQFIGCIAVSTGRFKTVRIERSPIRVSGCAALMNDDVFIFAHFADSSFAIVSEKDFIQSPIFKKKRPEANYAN